MIDDGWAEDYGRWEFNRRLFPDPKGMIDRLHALGFRVMLWTCPFISPDSVEYKRLRDRGLLIRDAQGRIGYPSVVERVFRCSGPLSSGRRGLVPGEKRFPDEGIWGGRL